MIDHRRSPLDRASRPKTKRNSRGCCAVDRRTLHSLGATWKYRRFECVHETPLFLVVGGPIPIRYLLRHKKTPPPPEELWFQLVVVHPTTRKEFVLETDVVETKLNCWDAILNSKSSRG
jgi:hypothetical protein